VSTSDDRLAARIKSNQKLLSWIAAALFALAAMGILLFTEDRGGGIAIAGLAGVQAILALSKATAGQGVMVWLPVASIALALCLVVAVFHKVLA